MNSAVTVDIAGIFAHEQKGWALGMSGIFTEVAFIAEVADEQAVMILSEDFFNGLPEDDRDDVVRIFLLLAIEQVARELRSAPEVAIEISGEPEHAEIVLGVSLMINEIGSFEMATYFGPLAHPGTSVRRGLARAGDIISVVRQSFI